MLAAALERTRARMSLGARLGRAGFAAVLAAIAVELGFVAQHGLLHAREAGLAAGAVFLLGAFVLLMLGRRPSPVEAARKIDAALGHGALLETAAEALSGRHPGFAEVLARDAEASLAGRDLRALVPLGVPRLLGVGIGAALLLLVVALGPVTETPEETAETPILVPDVGAGTPDAPKKVVKGEGRRTNASGNADRATAELARDLRDLAARLERTDKPESPEEVRHREALERALERGDTAAARQAMTGLARTGSKSSARAVARAADTLTGKHHEDASSNGGAGTGPGKGSAPGDEVPVGTGPEGPDSGKGALEMTPWRVLEAERRYRAAIE